MSTPRVWDVPSEQYYQKLRNQFGNDSLLARLTIENWLKLMSLDYRSETLRMYALSSDAVFMEPVNRRIYQVIMPIGEDFRASFSAFEFGLLATLLAYRELSPVGMHFVRDFSRVKCFMLDFEAFHGKRLISRALEKSESLPVRSITRTSFRPLR